jgi:hypothetical protein
MPVAGQNPILCGAPEVAMMETTNFGQGADGSARQCFSGDSGFADDGHKRESQICILAENAEVNELRIRTQKKRFAEILGGWRIWPPRPSLSGLPMADNALAGDRSTGTGEADGCPRFPLLAADQSIISKRKDSPGYDV